MRGRNENGRDYIRWCFVDLALIPQFYATASKLVKEIEDGKVALQLPSRSVADSRRLGQKRAAKRASIYISAIRVDNKSSVMQRRGLNVAALFRPQPAAELFPATSSPLLTLSAAIPFVSVFFEIFEFFVYFVLLIELCRQPAKASHQVLVFGLDIGILRCIRFFVQCISKPFTFHAKLHLKPTDELGVRSPFVGYRT
jgi:hypothetical protein